ncbi:hypothetical protein [Leuconostoc mesenteroides]|uniref:hypothetical protein n=1 Tax=Leuconostoc mesenteroides TaxID=1245 RepID=UPI002361FE24|nr:hypothetical protein [Leuconostoc mesenteroides]
MLNLENVKGMSIPTYSDKQIREMLSTEDLREFLELLDYEDTPGTVVLSNDEVYQVDNKEEFLQGVLRYDVKHYKNSQLESGAIAA